MKRDPHNNPQAVAAASLALAQMILQMLIAKEIFTLGQMEELLLRVSFKLGESDSALSRDTQALLMDCLEGLKGPETGATGQ